MESKLINYSPEQKDMQVFISKTFLYFGLALLIAGGAAYSVVHFLPQILPYLNLFSVGGLFLVYMGLIFTSWKWAKIKGLGVGLFFLTVAISGALMSGILFQMLSSTIAMQAWIAALGSASLLFATMWVIGFTTTMDLSKYSTLAFGVLIALIITSVVNIFLGSQLIVLIISAITIPLFAFFTAYDFKAIKEGLFETPVEAALMLYIDFVNLFRALFEIIYALMNND